MSDYILRGTKTLLAYKRTLNVNVPIERIAAAVGLPVAHFAGEGEAGAAYVSPKYAEHQAQALADLLGVTVANVTTNGGQEIVG